MTDKIGVIGAGAWGTALAQAIALSEKPVLLWAKETKVFKSIQKHKRNDTHLPSILLAETIEGTQDLEHVFETCNTIFMACPAPYYTEILTLVASSIRPEHQIIICSKGLRESDGALLSDVIEETLHECPSLGVLAGPGFAVELATGKPCMLTISSPHEDVIKNVNSILSLPSLRLYHNEDIIGAQIGGALKNALAIASGIAHEMDLGESVQAAIISRGLKEMERYALSLGGQKDTVYGLAGLGDVILTARSELSRNFRFGQHIGRGLSVQEALDATNGYVEGLNTARIVTLQSFSQGIDMGIISAIDGILKNDVSADKVIQYLMQRPRTHE